MEQRTNAAERVAPLLRRSIVQTRSAQSKSALYDKISRGLWTRPVQVGGRAVAWPANEVDALNAARIAGLGEEAIKGLVVRLHAQRRLLVEEVL